MARSDNLDLSLVVQSHCSAHDVDHEAQVMLDLELLALAQVREMAGTRVLRKFVQSEILAKRTPPCLGRFDQLAGGLQKFARDMASTNFGISRDEVLNPDLAAGVFEDAM